MSANSAIIPAQPGWWVSFYGLGRRRPEGKCQQQWMPATPLVAWVVNWRMLNRGPLLESWPLFHDDLHGILRSPEGAPYVVLDHRPTDLELDELPAPEAPSGRTA